ncbi:IclR family transcriptional regulator [Ramlibacter henchirensis]|uniref:IclR family transcriptional regulator n=1 Tax=Ramlibacter henchirensis TaxID=204072 RepID=A0A4Z0BXD8_9BURK|nr:helix-turn-helix domain-containing protein [Ramlibacter henchirensis]TFZ02938.1 IclR family transcriptional regulator [Ramlibacter henchirensis]
MSNTPSKRGVAEAATRVRRPRAAVRRSADTETAAPLVPEPLRADDDERDGRSSSALARGIGLLRCFTPAQPTLGSRELIERSGLPKPTAFRAIQTLVELGLLHSPGERGLYRLAPGVLALSLPLLSAMTIRSVARPLMQELADHVQGLVSLAAGTEQQRPLFVELCAGKGNAVFRPELGSNTSLSRSAAGRAYLVLLDDESRERHLRPMAAADPERAAWLREKLDETRAELARRGYCYNRGELDPITVGVAVPVRTRLDGQFFCFGCTVPSYRLSESPELLNELGLRLATLVQNVSATLGIDNR